MVTTKDVNGPLGSVEASDAERAIRRAILLYCKGIDTCDADTVMEAFHSDATTDYGAAQGKAADFAKGATSKLREYAIATKHFPSDSLITFTSATTADVETQVIAWHRCSNERGEYLENFAGRYWDSFECRDGDWRIVHRRLTHDWDILHTVEPAFPAGRYHPSPRK